MAMVKRLVEHGHRNIIYYCYDKVLQLIPSFKERLAGYREGMLDAGLKPEIIYHDYKIVTEKSFCDNFMEQLYFTKKHSSASRPSVTCIFASSNEQVKMLIPLLSQCGISVPGEISLCGYGNSNDNTLPSENGLTNICCVNEDWHELGKAVAGKMLSRLCGDDSVPSWTLIPCSILDGDTFCPNNQ
jgi:DNA-binding LacI/PurR family transcriptional regulator